MRHKDWLERPQSGETMVTALVGAVGSMRLAVLKAMKMSPLLLAPSPPTQARPVVARRARRWHWIGNSGALSHGFIIGSTHTSARPVATRMCP